MIKLLLVSPKMEHANGGIAVWTDIFLKHCLGAGIECDLLNIATIGARAKQGNAKRNIADEFARTAKIFRNLSKLLKKDSYDATHINTSCGTFGLIRDYLTVRKIRKKQPNCKRVVHFHCDIQTQCKSKVSIFFLRELLNMIDEALVLNQKNKEYLEKNYNAEVSSIPNFIDEDIILRGKKNIRPTIKQALFVGFVQPEKGIREIYDLAVRLPNIEFRLIGAVREDVLSWDKPDNILLSGFLKHEEIIKALDETDVFVFPSHSEGFSMALLESMARGVPAIATDVGANSEMLEDKCGIIVEAGDVDAMEQAIYKIEAPDIREKMSYLMVNTAKKRYITSAVVSRLKTKYVNKTTK